MGPQVTAASFIFILLQKSSSPLLSDRSSPLLSKLVPPQSCKCSWVSSEPWAQSLQPMNGSFWSCFGTPVDSKIYFRIYKYVCVERNFLWLYDTIHFDTKYKVTMELNWNSFNPTLRIIFHYKMGFYLSQWISLETCLRGWSRKTIYYPSSWLSLYVRLP